MSIYISTLCARLRNGQPGLPANEKPLRSRAFHLGGGTHADGRAGTYRAFRSAKRQSILGSRQMAESA